MLHLLHFNQNVCPMTLQTPARAQHTCSGVPSVISSFPGTRQAGVCVSLRLKFRDMALAQGP